MFDLHRSSTEWTLTYKVSLARRLLWIAVIGAVLLLTTIRDVHASVPATGILAGIGVVIVVFAYWMLTDANTETIFNLELRLLHVQSRRPFFGPVRTVPFDGTTLDVEVEHSRTSSAWVPRLRLPDGSRVVLGRETRNAHSTIREWIEEIRAATGIGGVTEPE